MYMINVRYGDIVTLFWQDRWHFNWSELLFLIVEPRKPFERYCEKTKKNTLEPKIWAVPTVKKDFILKEVHQKTCNKIITFSQMTEFYLKTTCECEMYIWKSVHYHKHILLSLSERTENVTCAFHSNRLCVFLLPCDEKVHCFFGLEHLSGAVDPSDSSQTMHVISGVQGCAGEADRTTTLSDTSLKHITHFTVEVRVRRQPVEDQVMDTLDSVSKRKEN